MRILLFILLLLTTTFSMSFANGLEGTHWKSDYISSIGVYQLVFDTQGTVLVTVDPNNCFLDELGQTTSCTKIAIRTMSYRYEVAPIAANRRTLAYNVFDSITGTLVYRLVSTWPVDENNSNALRLLLLNENGQALENLRLLKF